MRPLIYAFAFIWSATAALANPDTERLLDAIGLPDLIAVFAIEGQEAGAAIDDGFLNGQGGAVWDETVRRLYDPQRLEQEMRAGVVAELDGDMAAQALMFFDSDLGQKIVELEVQARRAMLDPALEARAKSASSANSNAITRFLEARNLVVRNTDVGVSSQTAFFAGLTATSPSQDALPDPEARRDTIRTESEAWLRGYYALAQSPLSEDEVAIYTAFWETDVGKALDDALFSAFANSYETLSFALGQAAGRLSVQNEL